MANDTTGSGAPTNSVPITPGKTDQDRARESAAKTGDFRRQQDDAASKRPSKPYYPR